MVRFVGLDGAQGSGKSTYATKLIAKLSAGSGTSIVYIETDDFLADRDWRDALSPSFFEALCYRKLWDFEQMAKIIEQLKKGPRTVSAQGLYNRKTGKRDREQTWVIESDSTVLVAGPLLLEAEFDNLFDHMIFMDVPKEERLRRILSRNRTLGRSEEATKQVFDNFEKIYEPYWSGRKDHYDEIIRG